MSIPVNCSDPVPPIASTISLLSFIGGGIGFGSLPKMYPKSTWNTLPETESNLN